MINFINIFLNSISFLLTEKQTSRSSPPDAHAALINQIQTGIQLKQSVHGAKIRGQSQEGKENKVFPVMNFLLFIDGTLCSDIAIDRQLLEGDLRSCQTMPHWGTSSEFQRGEIRFKTRHYVILHVFLRYTILLPVEIRYTYLTEARRLSPP